MDITLWHDEDLIRLWLSGLNFQGNSGAILVKFEYLWFVGGGHLLSLKPILVIIMDSLCG